MTERKFNVLSTALWSHMGSKKNDGATRLSIKYPSTQVRRLLSHSEIPIAWPEQYSSEAHSLTGFLVLELGRLDSLSRAGLKHDSLAMHAGNGNFQVIFANGS